MALTEAKLAVLPGPPSIQTGGTLPFLFIIACWSLVCCSLHGALAGEHWILGKKENRTPLLLCNAAVPVLSSLCSLYSAQVQRHKEEPRKIKVENIMQLSRLATETTAYQDARAASSGCHDCVGQIMSSNL